jgi:hypothetical protein
MYGRIKTEVCGEFMESTNHKPAYLINIRKIRRFFNQVENFQIRMDGENVVLIGIKMNAITRTQSKQLQLNHNSPPPRLSSGGYNKTRIVFTKYANRIAFKSIVSARPTTLVNGIQFKCENWAHKLSQGETL